MCLVYGYSVQSACLHCGGQTGLGPSLFEHTKPKVGSYKLYVNISSQTANTKACGLTLYSFSSFPMKRLAPTMRSGVAAQQPDILAFQSMTLAF